MRILALFVGQVTFIFPSRRCSAFCSRRRYRWSQHALGLLRLTVSTTLQSYGRDSPYSPFYRANKEHREVQRPSAPGCALTRAPSSTTLRLKGRQTTTTQTDNLSPRQRQETHAMTSLLQHSVQVPIYLQIQIYTHINKTGDRLNLINSSLHHQPSFIIYVWFSFILCQFKNNKAPGTNYLVFLISETCSLSVKRVHSQSASTGFFLRCVSKGQLCWNSSVFVPTFY